MQRTHLKNTHTLSPEGTDTEDHHMPSADDHCLWSGANRCLGSRARMIKCPACLYGRLSSMILLGDADVRMEIAWKRLQQALRKVPSAGR